MSVKVLFGSETGNSENLANKAVEILGSDGIDSEVIDMKDVTFDKLKEYEKVLIITSTFGDGEPPYNASALYDELQEKSGSNLEGVKFAVFALGQSFYEHFAKAGLDFHEYLVNNGAKGVKEVVTSDDDFDTTFEPWLDEIKVSL